MSEAGVAQMAVCGLDCGSCSIRRIPFDGEAAERMVTWYREQGWLHQDEGVPTILERCMYCNGCLADRDVHWSPDCWILQWCVDGHELENCSQCADFACARLQEWATQNDGYAAALERLRELAAA